VVHKPTLNKLETLRRVVGRPIILNSAYRSDSHNRRVGGAKNSYHKRAMAFDCRMDNHNPADFEAAARSVGFTGFGFYRRQNFMHIDTGPRREWNKRWWNARSIGLMPEQPVIESSILKNKGFQGVTMSAGGFGAIEAISVGGDVLGRLHPNAQMIALAVAGLAIGAGLILGWRQLREMMR
jgi:hypothetical protein